MKHSKRTLVDQMRNFLEKNSSSSLEEEEDDSREKSTKELRVFSNNDGSKNSIVMVKKEKNFCRRIFNVLPSLGKGHIDQLFGVASWVIQFISINERAIENPGF